MAKSLAQRENSDIQYIYPTEGAMLWQDNYVISAKTTHEDAAYAWINYTMQGDMFWMMLRTSLHQSKPGAGICQEQSARTLSGISIQPSPTCRHRQCSTVTGSLTWAKDRHSMTNYGQSVTATK